MVVPAPKQKMQNERLVCIWMFWIMLMTPLVYFFSEQDQYSHRFVPFLGFMAIFFGMTIVNIGNFVLEHKLKAKPKPSTSVKTAIINSYKFWKKKPTPKT
jgi:hypothetical protein